MKPEETDHLFREKLDKLEQVPGLEWSDDAAWNKINSGLNGSWNPAWTWTLSVITVIVSLYVGYRLTSEKESIQPRKVVTVLEVKKEKEIKIAQETAKENERKVMKKISVQPIELVSVERDSVVTNDTLPERILPEQNVAYYPQPAYYLSGSRLAYIPVGRSFSFSMPQQTAYNMSVNNSFNLSNFFKSVDAQRNAGENSYFIYEYNNSFSQRIERYPYPGAMNTRRAFIIDYNK